MAKLDVLDVIGNGVETFCFLHYLVGRDENELGVLVDEFLDQPWAGDAVDLDPFPCDPLHGIPPVCLYVRACCPLLTSLRQQSVFRPMRDRPFARVLDGSMWRQRRTEVSHRRQGLHPLPPSAEGGVFRIHALALGGHSERVGAWQEIEVGKRKL